MEGADRIFLVGPMGVGKTTIGRRLASALAKTFVDSDHEIEKRTGVDIPLIFELEGEAGFRRRESKMIDELTQRPAVVLATGGGAVLDPQNRQHLRERGFVIYLHASLDRLLERTARDKRRPLLQTEDPRARLQQILEQRGPLYEQVADLKVSTNGRNVRKVVREILSCYRGQGSGDR